MSFFQFANAAIQGYDQAQQRRKQDEDLDRRRLREDQDRFLAQRQQALNLAMQIGDEGAAQRVAQGTPYEGLDFNSHFARVNQERKQEEEDRARKAAAQSYDAFRTVGQDYRSGLIPSAESALAQAQAMGYQPPTEGAGAEQPRPAPGFMGPMPEQTRMVNEFLKMQLAPKTATRHQDLGDRVVTYWSDGTQTSEKKGAAPQASAPTRPEMKIVMRNGVPTWAYPKDGEPAFVPASQSGAPKPQTEVDRQRTINQVTTGAHQDALRAAGAQPRQPDPSLATPQALADYEKRAQEWNKKFQGAYSKALANRGYAQTFDGQLVSLGSPTTTPAAGVSQEQFDAFMNKFQ